MKRKPKAWVLLAFGGLALSLLSSCATYGVIKNEIIPNVKATVIAAGPNLFSALLNDVVEYALKPIGWVEDLMPKESDAPTE